MVQPRILSTSLLVRMSPPSSVYALWAAESVTQNWPIRSWRRSLVGRIMVTEESEHHYCILETELVMPWMVPSWVSTRMPCMEWLPTGPLEVDAFEGETARANTSST